MSNLKFDKGKVPLWQGLAQYFPNALKAVAEISDYGFKKYGSWGGWVEVEDGNARYLNALYRHLLAQDIEGEYDPESNLRHQAHAAWNALAVLELDILAEQEAEKDDGSKPA